MKESITPPIAKKNIDTVNKTDKSKASKRKKDKSSSSNKSDKGKSLDKSRSTQRTGILLSVVDCCGRGYTLIEIDGTITLVL